MAITITKNPSGLRLRYDCGLNEETGKTIVRSKTYSNLDPAALAQDAYDVAASIASLQSNSLLSVDKIDNSTLSQ